jgi:hypothetical protein
MLRRLASTVAVLVLSGTARALVLCTTPDGKTYVGDKPPPGCQVKSKYTSLPALAEPQPAEPAAASPSADQQAADNAFMVDALRRRRALEKDVNDAADRLAEANEQKKAVESPNAWLTYGGGDLKAFAKAKREVQTREAKARVRLEDRKHEFEDLNKKVREHFHGVAPASWRSKLNCKSCP